MRDSLQPGWAVFWCPRYDLHAKSHLHLPTAGAFDAETAAAFHGLQAALSQHPTRLARHIHVLLDRLVNTVTVKHQFLSSLEVCTS